MSELESLRRYVHRLGTLVMLIFLACLASAAEGAQQPKRLSEAKPVAGEAADGLVSWSLSGQDFDCLQDRRVCSAAAGQAAVGIRVARKAVDMRPCLSSVPVLSAQAGRQSASQVGEIPACYFEFFADMQEVDYPAPELLWQALKAKLSLTGRNNIQRKKLVEVLERNQITQINAALLHKLSAESSLWALLAPLEGKPFDSAAALLHELDPLLIKFSERFEQYRPLVLAQARKVHRYDIAASPLQWRGETCKCTQRDLSGEVYGFMPFWLAGGGHVIDSGVQTRLGYYAVGFDDRGIITHDERWRGMDTNFIHEFRANGGKLDMVVYRNDWVSWSQASQPQGRAAFESLAANIVKLIEIPRTDLFFRLKFFVSLGLTARPVMGDGVTLYFDRYPQDRESVEALGQFLDDLSNQLKTNKRDYSLNLMFGSAEAGKGIFDYQKLAGRLDRFNSKHTNQKMLFLVLLQEPTTHEKKRLRQDIENALHGEQRRNLLRHVVTILSFDGHNKDQLDDDIIYAKDNFGGIGLWMQPAVMRNNEVNTAVSAALHQYYLNAGNSNSSSVGCKAVCSD